MRLSLLTWNGNSINDSSFTSWIQQGQLSNLSANAVTVNRADDFPFLSTTVLNPHVLVLGVSVTAGSDINAKRELLKKYFNVIDKTRHNLIAKDVDDSDRQYYVTGFPVRIAPSGDRRNEFIVTLQLEYPYWRVVTALSDTWNITASGQTRAITNIGNISVRPSYAVTPTSAKTGGLQYRRPVFVYNNLDVTYTDSYDLTGGGLDTAALTTAKLQADGSDLRVWMDGVEVDRWLDAIDTAATKVWINLSLSPRKEGTTSGNIAASGAIASISFTRTKANLAFLQALKKATNKIILIDDEAFAYTAANVDTFNCQILSPSRAQKGTSEAAHAAPKTARHIEHDIWILYGDSSLSDPDTDDDNKPIFSLASTNGVRTYANFYDSTAARPGAWAGEVNASRTGLSYTFTGDANTFVNPSTHLGLALIGSADFQVQNESGVLGWIYTHPAGIDSVTYSGDKYRSGSFPAIIGLQYLQPSAAWFTAQNETEPATTYTWEAFGPRTVSTSSAQPETIRFVIDGLLSSAISEMALIQFDTVSVTLVSANLPTVSVGAEQAAYELDFVLANNTTSDSIRVHTPIGLNETLTIDCDGKQASLSDGGRAVVSFSADRSEWLDLASGSNTLAFTDTGTNAVTIVTTHRDRNL